LDEFHETTSCDDMSRYFPAAARNASLMRSCQPAPSGSVEHVAVDAQGNVSLAQARRRFGRQRAGFAVAALKAISAKCRESMVRRVIARPSSSPPRIYYHSAVFGMICSISS